VVDHFSIDVGGGSANTCNPFNFSVIAEDSSNNPVPGYTGTIGMTTSSGNGNFSTVSATNSIDPNPDNDDNGSAGYTFDTLDNGTVTLALANEHAETLTLTLSDSSIPASGTSANIIFRDNAFTITDNDALVAVDNVPVAGRDHAYQIQMIRKDPITGCGVATGYDGNKALKMWRLQNSADPSPNAPLLAGTSLPAAEPVAANGNIVFSAGIANVILASSDIGQFTIELADISNTFAEISITGTSAEQTVRPFGLAVSNIVAANSNPGGTEPDDEIFATAGSDFSATVAAVLWNAADDTDNDGDLDLAPGVVYADNAIAPSYAWDTDLSVSLDPISYTPSSGTPGDLENSRVEENEFVGGSAVPIDLQYTEVGSFTLQSAAVDYLGEPSADIVGDDIVVGRFIPAYFEVDIGSDGVFAEACGAFTYIGQNFGYDTAPSFTVTAKNTLDATTVQYRDAFVKLDDSSVTVVATQDDTNNGTDGMPLNVSYNPVAMTLGPQSLGVVSYTLGADIWRYGPDVPVVASKFANSQVGPFPADINPAITEISDGEVLNTTPTGMLDFDPAGPNLRFGRLRMVNVHGSELNDLEMPAFTEYWNGSSFQKNTIDTCTNIVDTTDLVSVADPPGLSIPTVVYSPPMLGDIVYRYPSPGAGNTGTVDTTTRLDDITIPGRDPQLWLRYDWDVDGEFDDDPTARATFGVFEGNPVQIYIQQVYDQ
jgi:MSHA biogenesis protein MshQ